MSSYIRDFTNFAIAAKGAIKTGKRPFCSEDGCERGPIVEAFFYELCPSTGATSRPWQRQRDAGQIHLMPRGNRNPVARFNSN
jgi:hypothetical protein